VIQSTLISDDSIFFFGQSGTTEGEVDKNLLGGKGAGLVEMARLGLPVPPGVVIPTPYCSTILKSPNGETLGKLATHIAYLIHEKLGKTLGYVPMVSVRSGARVSMPGMMDTILNVGISEDTLPFWRQKIGPRAAFDCYRRLIQMYGQTVKGLHPDRFKLIMKDVMAAKYDQPEKPKSEDDLSLTHLRKLIDRYLKMYEEKVGEAFPQSLVGQIEGAVGAVFKSWNGERAVAYRKEHKIPDDWFTACVVQAMVFGNLNEQSCSGVLFSRHPSTGAAVVMGEFLPNAQGEEVVSGTRTPMPLQLMGVWNPKVFESLVGITKVLEVGYKDMVDIEFTVQDGVLFILQVRAGKRSAVAAFKIAYDLVAEGRLEKADALKRLSGEQYLVLSKPVIDSTFKGKPIATGLPGSKGIATGKAWFTSAKAQANPGGILVTKETSPDDFSGMAASVGILTATGGATCHAAVVARGMDRACVVGCSSLKVGTSVADFSADGIVETMIKEGDEVTIDGNTGNVWVGKVPMVGGVVPSFVQEMIEWGAGQVQNLRYEAGKDDLPEEGEIYLSASDIKDGLKMLNLLAYLATQRPKLKGILSFEDLNSAFDDSKFVWFLGLPSSQYKVADTVIKELVIAQDAPIAKNWLLLGVPENLKCGFKVHRKVKTLKELFECDGYYEMAPELLKLLGEQGMTGESMVELLEKSGKKLKPITKPISKDQLAFAVFGK
jgi:pyruvate, orthophosphate dikinase